MNVSREIAEIGKLLQAAKLLLAVRKETAAVLKSGFVVSAGEGHDVEVRCGSCDEVGRRIKANVPDVDVERLADNVLGVSMSRRGR